MIKKNKKNLAVKYLILVLILLFVLNILASLSSLEKKKENTKKEENSVFVGISENSSVVKMILPAVDSKGKGVDTELIVEAVPGSGRTLVDIENLLFWADTQHSIRMARFVADNLTNVSVDNYDLIYNIKANASVIGGPSAGAAITIATIFALQGKQPRKDVMITGSINHDGSIGPVGAVLEKAKASKEAGASLFLVPLLQSRDVVYETKKHCQKFGFTEICTQETIPKKVDVSSEAGIEVVEVSNIREALKYFS